MNITVECKNNTLHNRLFASPTIWNIWSSSPSLFFPLFLHLSIIIFNAYVFLVFALPQQVVCPLPLQPTGSSCPPASRSCLWPLPQQVVCAPPSSLTFAWIGERPRSFLLGSKQSLNSRIIKSNDSIN